MPPNIILVVYPNAFDYGYMGGTSRLLQLAESWRRLGWTPILLARQKRGTAERYHSDLDPVFPGIVIRTRFAFDVARQLQQRHVKKAWGHLRALLLRETTDRKKYYEWARAVSNPIRLWWLKRRIRRRGVLKIVWAVTTRSLAGAMAGHRIAQTMKVPWIFALHDPPHQGHLNDSIPWIARDYQSLLRASSQILTTSRSYEERIKTDFPFVAGKIRTIYMRFDNSETCTENVRDSGGPQDVVRFSHVGRIHGKPGQRDLMPFLRALMRVSSILRLSSQMPLPFRIDVAGTGAGIAAAEAFVVQHGLDPLFVFHGNVPKQVAHEIHCSSDFILVIQGHTQQLQIPNKVFELLPLKKPVLALMPPQCEAAHILHEAGLATVIALEDEAGIASFLLSAAHDKAQLMQTIRKPNTDFISSFGSDSLDSELHSLLDSVRAPVR
jgi:hypothetical protein